MFDRTIFFDPVPLYEYHAQDMGTNALAMSVLSPIEANAKEEWRVFVLTGGDDQMLSVHSFALELRQRYLSAYELIHRSPQWFRYPCAATAAIKGVSILDLKASLDLNGFELEFLTVAWDQRLMKWRAVIPVSEDNRERAFTFSTQQSLLMKLMQIKPYQNQFEYYYQYSDRFSHLVNAFPPFDQNAKSEKIQIELEQGIVVYISEVASFSLLKVADRKEWLCAVIGEGFQFVRIY